MEFPNTQKRMRDMEETENILSATECTGLIPAMPWDEDTDAERDLYDVHRQPRDNS